MWHHVKLSDASLGTSPLTLSGRHRESRHSDGEKVNCNLRSQLSSQEEFLGYRGQRKTDRDPRRKDLHAWTNATLKILSYDGSTEWETFKFAADQMGLDDRKMAYFLYQLSRVILL